MLPCNDTAYACGYAGNAADACVRGPVFALKNEPANIQFVPGAFGSSTLPAPTATATTSTTPAESSEWDAAHNSSSSGSGSKAKEIGLGVGLGVPLAISLVALAVLVPFFLRKVHRLEAALKSSDIGSSSLAKDSSVAEKKEGPHELPVRVVPQELDTPLQR